MSLLGLLILFGPSCADGGPKTAAVQFKLDAPFCGSMNLRLTIDQVVVGTMTLKSGGVSPWYSTPEGTHTLGAAFIFGTSEIPRDTIVTLKGDQSFVAVLPFYCS